MKILSTILFATVALLVVTSCSIFRSRSNHSESVKLRDSVGQLDSMHSLYNYTFLNDNSEAVTLNAKGFNRLYFDSQGNLYTEGEHGELAVTKKSQNKILEGLQAEETNVNTSSDVHDSTTVEVDKTYSYTAKPDTWSVTWGGVVVMVVLLGGLVIFLKKVL